MRILLTLIVCLLILLCAAPLRCTVRVAYHGQLRITAALRVYGLPLPEKTLFPTRIRAAQMPKAADQRRLLAALRKSRLLHRVLSHLTPEGLSVQASLALSDAAVSARMSGALNSLPLILPSAWRRCAAVQVLPDFWSGQTQLRAVCIFSSHLGTLLVDAACLGLALWRQHTPSA